MEYNGLAKRAFDIAASSASLVVAAPLLALVTTFNAAYYRGNPFHTITRPGLEGKNFNIIKFKSMQSPANSFDEILSDKSRETKWGQFLRFTSIDELPQLINVIKGDMSIVGPRPRPQACVDKIPTYYKNIIQSVRPGLTGPWQISAIGSKEETPHWKRVLLDSNYVLDGITLKKDLSVITKTPLACLYGHNGESLSINLK